jgi:hypothetical protein
VIRTICAYLVAVAIAALLIAGFNYYQKAAIPGQAMAAPAFPGELPAPRLPDRSKKVAVVLSGLNGAEATWLRNLRNVDDGAVVTSSAVSSGIDAWRC